MQQNGHWGAQIYAHHSRIWLGTFKSERAAAMAYDSAAIKLHRSDSHRNFPWTELTSHEPKFQELFTTEAVLAMIRDGSYETKFADFLRVTRSSQTGVGLPTDSTTGGDDRGITCVELFQKELTPSDVGKLNRLVVPKKHAVQHFPAVSESTGEELLLEFRDHQDRAWSFRYCYWKSSQSYVFTKGWNKFVKEKGLRAKDVVSFYRCEEKEGLKRTYCMIDITRDAGEVAVRDGSGVPRRNDDDDDDELVELGLGSRRRDGEVAVAEEEEAGEVSSSTAADALEEPQVAKKVKIFGVCIN